MTFPRYADLSEWVDPEQQRAKNLRTLQSIRQQQERELRREAGEDSEEEENEEEDEEEEEGGDEMATPCSDGEDDDEMTTPTGLLGAARSVANVNKETVKEEEPVDDAAPPEGEHVYELYSILIHSGSASGGHYYAYIKVTCSPPYKVLLLLLTATTVVLNEEVVQVQRLHCDSSEEGRHREVLWRILHQGLLGIVGKQCLHAGVPPCGQQAYQARARDDRSPAHSSPRD